MRSLLGFGMVSALVALTNLAVAGDAVPITVAHANGSYQSGENVLYVLALNSSTLKFRFNLLNTYSGGTSVFDVQGEAKLVRDVATYSHNSADGPCQLNFHFLPKNVVTVGVLEYAGCGIGAHNSADGEYHKLKSGVQPHFFDVDPFASPKPAPGPGALIAQQQASATTVSLDRDDASTFAASASAMAAKLAPLAAHAKQVSSALTLGRVEFNKHVQAGDKALQHSKSGTAQARALARQTAQTEYQTAQTQGAALSSQLSELRRTEYDMEQLLTGIVNAEAEAVLSAKDAHNVSTQSKQNPAAATEAQTRSATATATARSSLSEAALGAPDAFPARQARTNKEDAVLRAQIGSVDQKLLGMADSAGGKSASKNSAQPAIAGVSEVPTAEVNQRYGAYSDQTMDAHPEIVEAMRRFDPDADVLALPQNNRAVRLSDGRELLLMAGRTCRACGQIAYWIVWEAKSGMVAFERGDSNVPNYGKADTSARAILDQFVKVSPAP